MISPSRALLLATACLVGLSGCDRGKDERTQAAGEILEGTVSDAMIQTDQIRSEAPLAPRKAERGSPAKAAGAGAAPSEAQPIGEAAAPAASETPEQAASPVPTPTPPAE
jgi:hypothetical protein